MLCAYFHEYYWSFVKHEWVSKNKLYSYRDMKADSHQYANTKKPCFKLRVVSGAEMGVIGNNWLKINTLWSSSGPSHGNAVSGV